MKKVFLVSIIVFGFVFLGAVSINFLRNAKAQAADDGLVAYYKFDGDTLDSSAYDRDGFNYGGTFVTGKIGQALSFDGIDDFVDITSNFGDFTKFSVEFWRKSDGFGITDWPRMISGWKSEPNNGHDDGFVIEHHATGLRGDQGIISSWVSPDGQNLEVAEMGAPASQGVWHFVTLTFDGTTAILFLDGVEAGRRIYAPNPVITINKIQIGGDRPMWRFFNGDIDEVKIYDRDLSASEILAHYNVLDSDGDGAPDTTDCAPLDQTVYPGAPEICDNLDNDCNSVLPANEIDNDSDGYVECTVDAGGWHYGDPSIVDGNDCNDGNAAINPGELEACGINGRDEDCDGSVDEGDDYDVDGVKNCTDNCIYMSNPDQGDNDGDLVGNACDPCPNDPMPPQMILLYQDVDGDGYGAGTQYEGYSCQEHSGYVEDNTDCDDNASAINPGATEVYNGIDDDCDGTVDAPLCVPTAEVCDGIDNDCDVMVDEGYDVDGDGVADCIDNCFEAWNPHQEDYDGDGIGDACDPCPQDSGNDEDRDGYCRSEDNCPLWANSDQADSDGDGIGDACDACTSLPEICDGLDNDCNSALPVNEIDVDGDGYVECSIDAGGWHGDPSIVGGDDCNGTIDTFNPGATEFCDGIDDNCDGRVDEGNVCPQTSYYCDSDGDTFISSAPSGTCNTHNCVPAGCELTQGNDCDDSNLNVNPGAVEVCNGMDDDCDVAVDEGVKTIFYADLDGDGFGDPENTREACEAPQGYIEDSNDCDDTSAEVRPGVPDATCDDIDNNCNGVADEFYVPLSTSCGIGACAAIGQTICWYGHESNSCVPGAPTPETCDNIDNDCDGDITDDGSAETWYNQPTSCGLGVCASTGAFTCQSGAKTDTCSQGLPTGDDSNCNGIDENCDGTTDNVYIPTPTTCGIGACTALGQMICTNGALQNTCVSGIPATEICSNGLDDDCDGAIDEGCAYNWSGFFQPVDNLPILNQVNAGRAIPMKFSLGGNMGLSIFEAGYPKSGVIACSSTAVVDVVETTVTAGGSSLNYDPITNQYNYVWKTEKTWTGCRQLVVKFIDGTTHYANFKFTK